MPEYAMKAALYKTFGGPIIVEDVEKPTAKEDGVVLQVMATGVCRSDWHGWKGHDGDVAAHGLPFCPGHELSGIVVESGRKVQRVQRGDRVAVPFILSCGACRSCVHHRQPTVCSDQKQPGFTQWGSFAEYVHIPRADRNVRRLPEAVSFLQAAALGCRFSTAYRAMLHQGKLRDGTCVAVFGCGGLGLSCIMLAATKSNCIIIAIDVSEAALQKARELGATHCIHIARDQPQDDVCKAVMRLTPAQQGADLTVDAAGFTATCENAVRCVRPAGRMVQVGLPIGDKPPQIHMGSVAGKEIEIVGSHGFSADDLEALLQLVATKQLDPTCLVESEVSLEEGCRVLESMDKRSPLGVVMITKFDTDRASHGRSNL